MRLLLGFDTLIIYEHENTNWMSCIVCRVFRKVPRMADQPGVPVDIPGYPLAVAYRSADGRLLVVLEFRAGRMGTCPMDRLICPWCRSKDFLIESKTWRRFLPGATPPKGRAMPSCGCRKGFKCVWTRYRNAGGTSHFLVDKETLKNG